MEINVLQKTIWSLLITIMFPEPKFFKDNACSFWSSSDILQSFIFGLIGIMFGMVDNLLFQQKCIQITIKNLKMFNDGLRQSYF